MYVALKQIGGGGEYCVTPARAAAKETPILWLAGKGFPVIGAAYTITN